MHDCEIPTTPLRVSVTSLGWMPDVALHRYRRNFIHESSYTSLVLSGVLFVVAAIFCVLPWNDLPIAGIGLPMKYCLALIFLIGAICIGAAFFLRNRFGQRLIIDPLSRTVTLRKTRAEAVLHWLCGRVVVADRIRHGKPVSELERNRQPEAEIVLDFSDIVGIQICGGPPAAYQVNLVFRTSTQALDRDCLANHPVKRFCTTLAQRYSNEFGFRIIDNVAPSRVRMTCQLP